MYSHVWFFLFILTKCGPIQKFLEILNNFMLQFHEIFDTLPTYTILHLQWIILIIITKWIFLPSLFSVDLHLFFDKVAQVGGYDGCMTKKAWKSIYDDLGGNPQNTSAATCTRRHYEKYVVFKKINIVFLKIENGN